MIINTANVLVHGSAVEVAVCTFDAANSAFDDVVLGRLFDRAEAMSSRVNTGTANNSTCRRDRRTALADCLLGLISEYAWKSFVNSLGIDTILTETEFKSANGQIDLRTADGRTVEVRSSIAKKGIEFALGNPFRVVGPYANSYKPGEAMKDFFVLTLYHVESKEASLDNFRSKPLTVWLVGGATSSMMQIAAVDTLTAAQLVGLAEPTSYRVVPLTRALTASAIARRLIDRIADEPTLEAPSPVVEVPKAPVAAVRPRGLFGGLRRVA